MYDNINNFNNIYTMFWLIHTVITVICITTSVTVKIAKTLMRCDNRNMHHNIRDSRNRENFDATVTATVI